MKLKHTKLQRTLEIVAILFLAGMVLYLAVKWDQIPLRIPGHFNAMGEIDKWTTKNSLLMLPIMAFVLYALLTVVSFFPKIWNVPCKVTESNRELVYQPIKTMLILMKIELVAVFSYIASKAACAENLSNTFILAFMTVLLVTLGLCIYKSYKCSKNG